ncbi:hypothetical protein B296_00043299 [Ensete ventricosum]|uniref:Retrotransposon gag domain-containing protein n=1 Tax=Ensete ventricosum TaxID=4639 RepID=A0A426XPB8_ENSVE|nr:hypothetical protein B296_00043299 [Ensete ventricosum]
MPRDNASPPPRSVNRRLNEVQKEFIKSQEELGKSFKGSSPFTPEIQDKPVSLGFRLRKLEAYNGSSDPSEHDAASRAQMTLYDTSDVLMCRVFPMTLRGPARMWYNHLKHPPSLPSTNSQKRSHLPKTSQSLRQASGDRYSRDPSPHPKGLIEKQIDVTVGGPASEGDSSSAQKVYTRATAEKRLRHHRDLEITFGSGEEEYPDHDDVLVISVRIVNSRVKRIMVDKGIMCLTDRVLVPMTYTLSGFTEDSISSLDTTTFLVMIGEEARSKTLVVSFMVVGLPSAYNVIIGHPTLNKLRTIVSTCYQPMKFPTRSEIGEAGAIMESPSNGT